MKFKNLVGKKFGRLEVLKRVENKGKETMWLCKCDCGKESIVFSSNLLKGHTKSCGCLKKESKGNLKHGFSATKLGYIYCNIKNRCFNVKCKEYKFYGGRGIKLCSEWLKDAKKFYEWATNNGYKEGLTIDRIDVNGNYEPNNCRWISRKEQNKNRRTNILITYNNETYILNDWSKRTGIDSRTIKSRIKKFGICDKVFYKGRLC